MERTERLLDLVALLLDAKEPISWAELREAFPEDYAQGSDEANERKFERDKAELLELGLPLTYVQGDDERRDGYLVDKEAYYLPEAGLDPDELAVLYAAGSAALASEAFPGRQELAHALRKIGFFAGSELPSAKVRMELSPVPGSAELPARLEQAWGAAAARKFVQISYYSPHTDTTTQRRVDPYGLALRRGLWTLVGHCHLRQGIRSFHVHRIRSLEVNASRPRTPDFEVPETFRLDDYVASYPWQHTFHAPVQVTLALSGELRLLASRLFPTAELLGEGRLSLKATDLEGLCKYALSLGGDCAIEAPPEAAERHRTMALRVCELHAEREPK